MNVPSAHEPKKQDEEEWEANVPRGDGWTGEERRAFGHKGDNWTLSREVWGTFLGSLPALAAATGAMISLYALVQVHSVEISHLKEADARHEAALALQRAENIESRRDNNSRLDKIDARIERVQDLLSSNRRNSYRDER